METTVSEKPIPTGEGLTFEKVWVMFQEMSRETDRKMQETDREIRETSREMREAFEQMTKETDRKMKKTEEFLDSLGKQMGGLHRSFGELAEHLVLPGILERFSALGYRFNAAFSRGLKIYDDAHKQLTEVDMLLMNGSCLMAVEVKATVVSKDITHHVKRMEILREYYDKQNDTRKLYGTIAGAMFEESDKQAAIDAGFYVIEQSGDTMKLDIPEGFVPREW